MPGVVVLGGTTSACAQTALRTALPTTLVARRALNHKELAILCFNSLKVLTILKLNICITFLLMTLRTTSHIGTPAKGSNPGLLLYVVQIGFRSGSSLSNGVVTSLPRHGRNSRIEIGHVQRPQAAHAIGFLTHLDQ